MFRYYACLVPLLLNSIFAIKGAANTDDDAVEVHYFGVYDDDQCKNLSPNLPDTGQPREVTSGCNIIRYTDSEGVDKFNAEDLFNCCENFMEFMQYGNTEVCGDPDNADAWIYNVMSWECDGVNTRSGQTYQKLTNYTRCKQRHNYNGLYGSNITEEQCNGKLCHGIMFRH